MFFINIEISKVKEISITSLRDFGGFTNVHPTNILSLRDVGGFANVHSTNILSLRDDPVRDQMLVVKSGSVLNKVP
jgi:hypothetical protein